MRIAELAGRVGTEGGGPDQMGVDIHQAHGARLRPTAFAVLRSPTTEDLAMLGSVLRRPHHAIDGQQAKSLEEPARRKGRVAPRTAELIEQMRQRRFAQPLPSLDSGARYRHDLLGVQRQAQLTHDVPDRFVAKQRQPDHQPDQPLGRQTTTAQGRRAGRLQGLFDPVGRNQLAETIERVGRQVAYRIKVGLQGSDQSKRLMENHEPLGSFRRRQYLN